MKSPRHLLAAEVEAEDVGHLRGEDGHGNTAREAHDDGIGDELDDRTQPEEPHEQEQHAAHERCHQKSRLAVLLDDAVNDDDEGAGRAANLDAAAAQQRDDKAGDDGRDDALLGRDARSDAEGDGQRQGDDADDDAGHQVAHKVGTRVVAERVDEFGPEREEFHFEDSCLERKRKSRQNFSFLPVLFRFFAGRAAVHRPPRPFSRCAASRPAPRTSFGKRLTRKDGEERRRATNPRQSSVRSKIPAARRDSFF